MRTLIILLLTFSTSSFALTSDRNKVAHITSDSVHYNHKTGMAKYIGHVHATQGTTEVFADNINLFRNTDHKIEKIIADGSPAKYTTLPDNEKEKLLATAKKIIYYPNSRRIELIGNGSAKMNQSTLSGEHIIYNINSETLTTLANKKNQTHIVLQPKKETTK